MRGKELKVSTDRTQKRIYKAIINYYCIYCKNRLLAVTQNICPYYRARFRKKKKRSGLFVRCKYFNRIITAIVMIMTAPNAEGPNIPAIPNMYKMKDKTTSTPAPFFEISSRSATKTAHEIMKRARFR